MCICLSATRLLPIATHAFSRDRLDRNNIIMVGILSFQGFNSFNKLTGESDSEILSRESTIDAGSTDDEE